LNSGDRSLLVDIVSRCHRAEGGHVPPEETSESAINLKGLASNVTVCVGIHARHAAQRVADVDVPFVACLLLEERLEHNSESHGQMEKRHETRQPQEDLWLRYGESVGAVAPVERLRLGPFPAHLRDRH